MKFNTVLRLIEESLKVALISLWVNRLRTILSLLGITIGIFAIITIYSAVDSLEYSIRESVESLGDNVVYIQKWSWGGGGEYKWWKMIQRPEPNYEDFQKASARTTTTEALAFAYGLSKTAKYRNNSIENVTFMGITHEYDKIWEMKIEEGRYFTELESKSGKPIAILGHDIADGLFYGQDPIGKKIKIMGRKLSVVGVMEKQGQSLVGQDNDILILVPALYLMKLSNPTYTNGNVIMAKAKPEVGVDVMIDELRGVMRSVRRLHPKADDDFALNEISILAAGMDQLFGIIGFAGTIIGLFSILVGGFGIANIMFVSVRERTGQIGIQKSLGAKNYFILWQFIFESVTLCVIGGLIGLLLVYIATIIIAQNSDFDIFLSTGNIVLGLIFSVGIGMISGIIPALQASRMDPVAAIRMNS